MALSQTFKSAFSNVPVLTKTLVTALLVLSCTSYIYTYRASISTDDPDTTAFLGCPFIGILPGTALYLPWTFLTAAFYESNIFSLAFSFIVLLFCGKYLERAWTSRELLKFVLITAILSNVVTWIGIILTFYITKDTEYLYGIQINGMGGVFSAFLVAFKHLVPEHRVALLGSLVTIRVKNLIGVATAVSIVGLVLFQAIVFYNLVNIGWVIGWVYIRFFKYQDGIRGDYSETFALKTFFPEFLQPIIGAVANTVFDILVSLRICRPVPRNYAYDLEGQTGVRPSPLPGSARAEAERRRALALKALDMRLSTKSVPAPSTVTASSDIPASSSSSSTAAAAGGSVAGTRQPAESSVLFEAEEMTAPSTTEETEKRD